MYQYPIKPNELYHYGTPRHSGRYPYGSGKRPRQDLEGRLLDNIKYADKRRLDASIKTNKTYNKLSNEVLIRDIAWNLMKKRQQKYQAKYEKAIREFKKYEKINKIENEELKRVGKQHFDSLMNDFEVKRVLHEKYGYEYSDKDKKKDLKKIKYLRGE